MLLDSEFPSKPTNLQGSILFFDEFSGAEFLSDCELHVNYTFQASKGFKQSYAHSIYFSRWWGSSVFVF